MKTAVAWGCIYKRSLNRALNDADGGVRDNKMGREVGVQQAFYVKDPKLRGTVPLVLEVVVKQGEKPVFKKYDDCKRDHPLLLLDYYERLVNIRRKQDDPCHTPDRREKDSTKDREECSARGQQDRARDRERERAAVRERPVRSCRRKDGYNLEYIEEMPYQNNYPFSHYQPQQRPSPPLPTPPPSPASPEQSVADLDAPSCSEQLSSLEEFKRSSLHRILDYDQIIQENGLHLISPAVIPACRGKADRGHIQPGACIPPLPPLQPLKEAEREISSEGFKDSEESEFLLDDRVVRERRRRERFQMREQGRNKRKRNKKIVKRKKPSGFK